MPIRFHCQLCQVALSIASRKSGETVTCPKCRTTVRVPSLTNVGNGPQIVESGYSSTSGFALDDRPLFERDDLAEIYGGRPSFVDLMDSETSDEPEVVPIWSDTPSTQHPGVHLGTGALIMIGVLQTLLLMATFAVGYLLSAWQRFTPPVE